MPSLVLFNQKICFSGDDLRTAYVFVILYRLLQFCLGISIIFLATRQSRRDEDVIEDLEECEGKGILSPLAKRGVGVVSSCGAFTILLSILGIGIAIPIFMISGRGTPTFTEPRKSLRGICYINLTLLNMLRIFGFVLSITASLVLVDYCDCVKFGIEDKDIDSLREACPNSFAWVSAMVALNITLAIDAIIAVGVCIGFAFGVVSPHIPATISSEKRWSILCRCCFSCCSLLTCCLFGGAEASVGGDFGSFALALSNLLHDNGILDVTPSDILVGLHMVQRIQRQTTLETRERLHRAPSRSTETGFNGTADSTEIIFSQSAASVLEGATPTTRPKNPLFLSARNPQTTHTAAESDAEEGSHEESLQNHKLLCRENSRDAYCMAEAARFMSHAQAAYSWVMFFLEHPFTAIFRITFLIIRQCACFKSYEGKVSGDYILRARTISLKETAGINDEDIVYASFKQGIVETPYFIALDHDWKTVVLSIRGTLSFEDMLTDISVHSVELKDLGEELGFNGEGQYCHAGMLACSVWIYRDLQRRGKLDEALAGEFSCYRLRIVGHSLGAGCAAVLSIFLRKKYPNLRCLAFSPPGCVLTKDLADTCSQWTTSFVLDSDIVPRLSIESFENLRDKLLETICRIKIPKYQVGKTATGNDLNSLVALSDANKKVLCDEPHDSDFRRQVEEFYRFQADLKAKQQSTFARLYPPGEIIQLFRTRDKSSFAMPALTTLTTEEISDSDIEYTAVWIKRTELSNVLLTNHLLSDHMPVEVKCRLQACASDFFGMHSPYTDVLDSTG